MPASGQSAPARRKLYAFTGGMFRNRQVRRILSLSGYDVSFGLPARNSGIVGVWGRTKYANRGIGVAGWRNAGLVTLEDAFLRSVHTGRSGAPPLGIVIDKKGIYFDTSRPSDLEDILNSNAVDDPDLLERASRGIERLGQAQISKYNAFDPALKLDQKDYVLVIDQTRGDASIRLGGADDETFRQMLATARAENPGQMIVIKTHPEVAAGRRAGHFKPGDLDPQMVLESRPLSPWKLLQGASSVYCVTSLLGFEAILAGHRPRVFGRPFYGGWGLSADEQTYERRNRTHSPASIFAGAMLLYPVWYDPYRDCLCDFETLVETLAAQARAWREDCQGYVALGMRLWKRGLLRRFFSGAGRRIAFESEIARAALSGFRGLVWASKETPELRQAFEAAQKPLLRLEDGFLRSRGLGAELVSPLSLVVDDLGIYFDPSRESRLERSLNTSDTITPAQLDHAAQLRQRLITSKLSKYNIGKMAIGSDWPDRKRILVPGQVEDDASVLLGGGSIRRNLDLLRRVRTENPEAYLIYKPPPDVEAGLRRGAIADDETRLYADIVLHKVDAVAAIDAVDEVWTMTSLLGFEALLRDRPVICFGSPFYAGWGLTRDLGPKTPRRKARPSLEALIHATLICYPRYFDPKTGLACPVEVVLDRLETGDDPKIGRANRVLSKLQGVFASFAPLWR